MAMSDVSSSSSSGPLAAATRGSRTHTPALPPPKRPRPSRPPPPPADEDEGDALISLLEQDLNTSRAARSPSYSSSARSNSASPGLAPGGPDGQPRTRPLAPRDADPLRALQEMDLPNPLRGARAPPSLVSQAWTRILDRAQAGIGDACYDSSDEEQAELEAQQDHSQTLQVEVARVLRCLRARAADIHPPQPP